MKPLFIYLLAPPHEAAYRECKSRARERGWGQEIHILHVNIEDFILFVIIELFPNNVFQLYCPKDYFKQNQWNTAGDNDHGNHEVVSNIMVVAMALAASTSVWRSWLIMKSASFRAVQPVWGKRIHAL